MSGWSAMMGLCRNGAEALLHPFWATLSSRKMNSACLFLIFLRQSGSEQMPFSIYLSAPDSRRGYRKMVLGGNHVNGDDIKRIPSEGTSFLVDLQSHRFRFFADHDRFETTVGEGHAERVIQLDYRCSFQQIVFPQEVFQIIEPLTIGSRQVWFAQFLHELV